MKKVILILTSAFCLGSTLAQAQDTTDTNRQNVPQQLNRQNDPAHLYRTDTTNVYQPPRQDTARTMPRPNDLYRDSTRNNNNTPLIDSTGTPGITPANASERKKKQKK